MVDLTGAPSGIQALACELSEAGTPFEVHRFASPADQQWRALVAAGTLQVTADRGQWFIELAPPGGSDYFDAAVWDACLTGTDVSLELWSVSAQVTWMAAFLRSGTRAVPQYERLHDARDRRAYGRLGLTP